MLWDWLRNKLDVLLTQGVAEREYRRLCKERPNLTDREFFDSFYRSSGIRADTCSRIRSVLKTQLSMANVRPTDNVALINDEVDIWDICLEIAEEFELSTTPDDVKMIDGTVDSIIRTFDRLRSKLDAETAGHSA